MKKLILTFIILLTWYRMSLHEYKLAEERGGDAGAEIWSGDDYMV